MLGIPLRRKSECSTSFHNYVRSLVSNVLDISAKVSDICGGEICSIVCDVFNVLISNFHPDIEIFRC